MGNDNVWTLVDGQRVAKLAQLVSAGSKKENAPLFIEKSLYIHLHR